MHEFCADIFLLLQKRHLICCCIYLCKSEKQKISSVFWFYSFIVLGGFYWHLVPFVAVSDV